MAVFLSSSRTYSFLSFRMQHGIAPGFRKRLGYYMIGLAIGFGMLGVLWWGKANVARSGPAVRVPLPAAAPTP